MDTTKQKINEWLNLPLKPVETKTGIRVQDNDFRVVFWMYQKEWNNYDITIQKEKAETITSIINSSAGMLELLKEARKINCVYDLTNYLERIDKFLIELESKSN